MRASEIFLGCFCSHMNSSSGVHPAETRNCPPSSRDDTTLLDQCIPAMGHPGLINPGHGGSLPSGGSGRQNVALTAQKSAPRSNPPLPTCTSVPSGGKPSAESLCAAPDSTHWQTASRQVTWKWAQASNESSVCWCVTNSCKSWGFYGQHRVRVKISEVTCGLQVQLMHLVDSSSHWSEDFCSCFQSKPCFRLLCSSRDNPKIRR